MNTGRIIKRIVFIAMWISIGGGMLFLLLAAMGRQKREHCKGYVITIGGTGKRFFVDKNDVQQVLIASSGGRIKGQKKIALNLRKMEQALEKNVWIRDAELWFDNQELLNVSITEREPVARIFTVTGKSYYVDADYHRLPLSEKLTAEVPIFTGFPEKIISKRDSLLLKTVIQTASFILDRPFWMAQVAQIDITRERKLEMVPMVGNHKVILGDGEQIERKFRKLFIFYKNVLSKTGFEKYSIIDVQFAGQVVASKDGSAKRDTAQLRRNVEKLLRQAREMQDDSLMTVRLLAEQRTIKVDPLIAAVDKSTDSTLMATTRNVTDPVPMTDPVPVTGPVPMKPLLNAGESKGQPKAVMKPIRQNRQR